MLLTNDTNQSLFAECICPQGKDFVPVRSGSVVLAPTDASCGL